MKKILTIIFALLGLCAIGASVISTEIGNLHDYHNVVTNVDLTGLATSEDIEVATNALMTADGMTETPPFEYTGYKHNGIKWQFNGQANHSSTANRLVNKGLGGVINASLNFAIVQESEETIYTSPNRLKFSGAPANEQNENIVAYLSDFSTNNTSLVDTVTNATNQAFDTLETKVDDAKSTANTANTNATEAKTLATTAVSMISETNETFSTAVLDVVTNIDASAVGKVQSVNGKTGAVQLNASDVGALPLVDDYKGKKTAVTIGSRDIEQRVGMYSLANGGVTTASGYGSHAEGDGTTASGDYSHAEGVYTTASGDYSHAEGIRTTASGYYSHAEGEGTTASGYVSHTDGINSRTRSGDQFAFAWNGDDERTSLYSSHGPGTYNINPVGGLNGFFIGEQTLFSILTNKADNAVISAENPTFSNAVLAVGLNIDTNSVATLNEIADTFGGFPIEGTATTVGGLLAALAAAVAWLKKNKVGSFEPVGGASATVDNGVAKLDDFFTNSNSLLTGTIDEEIIEKGTAPDAHLEAPTDERLKLVLADNSVAYDSAKALPYKLTSVIGDRVIATMTLTAASTDITLPTIAANDTTVKDFILDVTNAYAVEGVATDAGINIPRTDFKLVTRDGESLTDVTTVKAGKSAFLCFTQKSPVVVGGTTYPCWCVIQLPFGDPS